MPLLHDDAELAVLAGSERALGVGEPEQGLVLGHEVDHPLRAIAGRDRPPWRCQNPVGAGPPGKPHLDRIEPSAPTASRNWPRSSPDSNRDDSTWT